MVTSKLVPRNMVDVNRIPGGLPSVLPPGTQCSPLQSLRQLVIFQEWGHEMGDPNSPKTISQVTADHTMPAALVVVPGYWGDFPNGR